jgi:hypothetical protein
LHAISAPFTISYFTIARLAVACNVGPAIWTMFNTSILIQGSEWELILIVQSKIKFFEGHAGGDIYTETICWTCHATFFANRCLSTKEVLYSKIIALIILVEFFENSFVPWIFLFERHQFIFIRIELVFLSNISLDFRYIHYHALIVDDEVLNIRKIIDVLWVEVILVTFGAEEC